MTERGADRAARPADPEIPEEIRRTLSAPFDSVLADATRLRIQAALHGLPADSSIRFTMLARTLGLSDGNLASHLAVLSEVGYARSSATYAGKRRTQWFTATPAGREAFEAYVDALRTVVDFAQLDARIER